MADYPCGYCEQPASVHRDLRHFPQPTMACVEAQKVELARLRTLVTQLVGAGRPFLKPCREEHEHPVDEVIEMIVEDPSILWPLRDALAAAEKLTGSV